MACSELHRASWAELPPTLLLQQPGQEAVAASSRDLRSEARGPRHTGHWPVDANPLGFQGDTLGPRSGSLHGTDPARITTWPGRGSPEPTGGPTKRHTARLFVLLSYVILCPRRTRRTEPGANTECSLGDVLGEYSGPLGHQRQAESHRGQFRSPVRRPPRPSSGSSRFEKIARPRTVST